MSDNYQAIFDAVRSRMSNGDIGNAVEQAIRNVDIGYYFQQALQQVEQAVSEATLPSVLYRPEVKIEGILWVARYSGVAGVGNSPAEAIADFNTFWYQKVVK